MSTAEKITIEEFMENSENLIEHIESIQDTDREKAISLAIDHLAELNKLIARFSPEQIREAKRKI